MTTVVASSQFPQYFGIAITPEQFGSLSTAFPSDCPRAYVQSEGCLWIHIALLTTALKALGLSPAMHGDDLDTIYKRVNTLPGPGLVNAASVCELEREREWIGQFRDSDTPKSNVLLCFLDIEFRVISTQIEASKAFLEGVKLRGSKAPCSSR